MENSLSLGRLSLSMGRTYGLEESTPAKVINKQTGKRITDYRKWMAILRCAEEVCSDYYEWGSNLYGDVGCQ